MKYLVFALALLATPALAQSTPDPATQAAASTAADLLQAVIAARAQVLQLHSQVETLTKERDDLKAVAAKKTH